MKTTHGLHRSLLLNRSEVAIHLRDSCLTWAQVGERVARMAGALCDLGVKPGDRVAVLMLNQYRYIELYLAVAWAGAVIVPLNTRWTQEENEFAVRDCKPRIMIVDHAFSQLGVNICANAHTTTLIYADDVANPTVEPMAEYEMLIESSTSITDTNCAPNDLAGIFYTGGTTGRSKGVMLSHRNLVANSRNWLSEGYSAQGNFLNVAPMFHLANTAAMYAALLSGASHSVLPVFGPQATAEAIERYGVTDTLLVPTMLQQLVDYPHLRDHDLSTLRRIVYGASPISEALLDRAMAALPHVELVQAYGMTELSPCVTFLPWRDHAGEARARNLHLSAGRPTFCVEARIVNDKGDSLPAGEVGEIIVRGETVMLGYWNSPKETAKAVIDGWMHTGDGGYITEDGYVFLVDRIKDMIISGGENVYSGEVENIVSKHPDVAQCAVIGRPHEKWGETVHAVIICRPGATVTEDELIAFCRDRMAGYKCPKSVTIRDEPLPLSGAGKILKRVLREQLLRHG